MQSYKINHIMIDKIKNELVFYRDYENANLDLDMTVWNNHKKINMEFKLSELVIYENEKNGKVYLMPYELGMNKIKDEYLITNYSLVKLFDGDNVNTITPSVRTQQGLVMYRDRDVFEKLFGGERPLALSLTENIGNFFLNFSKTIATAEAKETIKYYNHIKNDMKTIQNQTGGLDVKK